jgi:hypothetical protein
MKGVPNWFMALWCLLMPVTSFLLIPSIQGTIPAYFLAFVSVIFVILGRNSGEPNPQRIQYLTIALMVGAAWLLLLCGSQLGHLFSNRHDFGDMFLNDPANPKVLLRSTLFTQSLYLAACLCIALFFRFFFRAEWMRYVLWGGWLLAIYGIYEWLYFLIFQQPGDFIANRTYGESLHTGSWSQVIGVGPVTDKVHLWRAFLFLSGGYPLFISGCPKQAQMALHRPAFLCRFLHFHFLLYRFVFCFAALYSLPKKIKPLDRFRNSPFCWNGRHPLLPLSRDL